MRLFDWLDLLPVRLTWWGESAAAACKLLASCWMSSHVNPTNQPSNCLLTYTSRTNYTKSKNRKSKKVSLLLLNYQARRAMNCTFRRPSASNWRQGMKRIVESSEKEKRRKGVWRTNWKVTKGGLRTCHATIAPRSWPPTSTRSQTRTLDSDLEGVVEESEEEIEILARFIAS